MAGQHINILVFPAFYPPHIGGMESFAYELNNRLGIEERYSVTLFAPNFSGIDNQDQKNTEGVDILHYPAFEIIQNYPCPKLWSPNFWRLLYLISKKPHDIVISHTRFFIASFLASIFAKIKNIPLIHIEHGSSPVQSKSALITHLSQMYDHTLGGIVIRNADRIIAISDEVSRFIKKRWNRSSLVIHRGFDPKTIDAIPVSSNFPKKPGVTRLMYIGRLISGKGVDVLLDSLKSIASENWELYIIGDGPEMRTLQQAASVFDPEKIIFVGQKRWPEVIALLKTTNIFINPSRTEGLPTTIAEAALCSKAIIATDAGGTHALLPPENYDLLVPVDNPSSLSDKISLLLREEGRITTAGVAARQFVETNFTWEKFIQKFLKILIEIHQK